MDSFSTLSSTGEHTGVASEVVKICEEVVDVQLQSCTHECALWVDFVAEVAVDYARRRDLTCSFSEYLRGCALPVCVCACLR